jgi:hypothetical protein
VGRDGPTTSRQVRSLLVGRLADHPSVDGQALQLAQGELSQAMDRAQVDFSYHFHVPCRRLYNFVFKEKFLSPNLYTIASCAGSLDDIPGVTLFSSRHEVQCEPLGCLLFRSLPDVNNTSGAGRRPLPSSLLVGLFLTSGVERRSLTQRMSLRGLV